MTPNPLTTLLMRKRKQNNEEDNEETIPEKRLRVLRSEKTKFPQIMQTIEEWQLASRDWFSALNSNQRNSSQVWTQLVSSSTGDSLLEFVTKCVQKFPNNKSLFETLTQRLRQSEPVSPLLQLFVQMFLKKSLNPFVSNLFTSVSVIKTKETIEEKILVIFDSQMDFNAKYLKDLKQKKRIKDDFLDKILLKDFSNIFLNSFNCFVKIGDNFEKFNENYEKSEEKIPFSHIPEEWKKRVIYLTQSQVDLNVWPKGENKLIICHLNRREILDLGFFRENGFYFLLFNLFLFIFIDF